jgi:hypothetical protein
VEFTQLAAIDRTGRGDRRRWLSCAVPYDLSAIGSADLIIVPNWLSPTETQPEATLEALRLAHAKGARVAGLCSGVFVLAADSVITRPRRTRCSTRAPCRPRISVPSTGTIGACDFACFQQLLPAQFGRGWTEQADDRIGQVT